MSQTETRFHRINLKIKYVLVPELSMTPKMKEDKQKETSEIKEKEQKIKRMLGKKVRRERKKVSPATERSPAN